MWVHHCLSIQPTESHHLIGTVDCNFVLGKSNPQKAEVIKSHMLVCLDYSEKGGWPIIYYQTNYCPTASLHNNKITGCHWNCHLFRFLCEFGREDVALG